MSLQRAYHHLSEEKRAAIMALAREGFSGAHIARRCGISEATVSREFSRQFPRGIPLKERRKRYEASAAHTRYRENRKKSKPRGKLLPRVIKTTGKLIRQGYSPEQMANTVLKDQASTVSIYRWLYAGFLLYGDRSLLRHKGRRRVQRKEGEFSFRVQSVLDGIAKFFCKAFLYCLLSKNIFDPVVYLGHSPPVQVTLRDV